jgi:hypothetical protein
VWRLHFRLKHMFSLHTDSLYDQCEGCTSAWSTCSVLTLIACMISVTALKIVLSQRTLKWPNSKPHWATRQQAIAKTPAKWSAYQIPSVIVVFVILAFKVKFVSFYSQKPQEALNLLVTEECYWALFYMPLYTSFTQFAECTSTEQIKWDLKKTIILLTVAAIT